MLSYVEEDLEQIADALKEKSKSVRKWLTKLKSEYGKNSKNDEEDDSDWELKQPKEDDDLSYDTQPSAASTSVKRSARGKWKSRRGRQRSRVTAMKMKRGRARRRRPKPSPPTLVPLAESTTEMPNGITLQLGDVVTMRIASGKTSLAQIQGFLKDQYCEKYVHIRWMIPNPKRPVFNFEWYDPECYRNGGELTQNLSMKEIVAVHKLTPYSHEERDHDPKEVWHEDKKENMDEPSSNLTSVDHRWYSIEVSNWL